jgi:hypothetical protein
MPVSLSQLPLPTGVIELTRVYEKHTGVRGDCQARSLDILFATNELSPFEILEVYSMTFRDPEWEPVLVSDEFFTFYRQTDALAVTVDVSNDLGGRGVSDTVIDSSQQNYRAVYEVSLVASLVIPNPCREWVSSE